MDKYKICKIAWYSRRERLRLCRKNIQPYIMVEIYWEHCFSVQLDMMSLPLKYDKMILLFKDKIIEKYKELVEKSECGEELKRADYSFTFTADNLEKFSLDTRSIMTSIEIAEDLFDFIDDLMKEYDR